MFILIKSGILIVENNYCILDTDDLVEEWYTSLDILRIKNYQKDH